MWEVRVQHAGLNAYRVVRGATQQDAELKACLQVAAWDERWTRNQSALKARQEKLQKTWDTVESNRTAHRRTEELEKQRVALDSILTAGLAEQPFQWRSLKDTTPFTQPIPKEPIIPANPTEPVAPSKPDKPAYPVKPNAALFAPRLSTIDNLIRSRRLEKIKKSASEFEEAMQNWIAKCKSIDELHEKQLLANGVEFQKDFEDYLSNVAIWNQARDKALDDYSYRVSMWDKARDQHLGALKTQHAQIDALREEYRAGDPSAVEYFFAEVLNHSIYPESFPQGNMLSFNQSSGVMIVDFELPNQKAFPAIKELKFIASRQQFQEVMLSDAWLRKTFDDVLYQIALRTFHELFIADEATVLKSVVFNGWVQSIDKATGIEARGCILSIQVEREEFLQINLSQVDPKACFRKLKGIASSKLTELTPVRPILTINKEDSRFVEGYSVAETLDDRTNLAAMDWLDFENLIRELFEMEFSKSGGEVKITQASRDGGVDAIAFDPDPIRGGKIVIQAKRYTNVVGVSAVRDLYGTVHNEGATKGILVTTSTFGPDAYEFAKDKPLTLLSGCELLSLLAAHGHSAKIDLREAKALYLSKQS